MENILINNIKPKLKRSLINNPKSINNLKQKFKGSDLISHLVLSILSILFLLPIIYIISISFTKDASISTYGFRIIPAEVSVTAYEYILKSFGQLLRSYGVSIFVTLIGTFFSLFFTTMLAYTLSRSDFKYRKVISFYVFFTMIFNGGLVTTYILITRYLHLRDNILVLILPYIINAWYVLLMRSFLVSIPPSLIEAAKVDGASEWRIFFKIILPMAKPALTSIGLLISFTYWNDWWLAMLYIESEKLIPLQYMLQRIMQNIMFLSQSMATNLGVNLADIPAESARMAICLLAAGPMLIIFPFFQRYFVKGIIVGSLKGE